MLDHLTYPVLVGEIEVRAEGKGRTMSASFPYNRQATVASGGRVRKERFASGSLSWQVREFNKLQEELTQVMAGAVDRVRIELLEDALEKRNTFLLAGHDYNRSIADMRSGTLAVEHRADAVYLRADLPPEGEAPSWVEDTVRGIRGGQIRGVSPGFQVPAGQGREHLEREIGGPSMVRVIDDGVAFEYSLVSRPSYAGTSVDTRADELTTHTQRRRWWL